MMVNEDKQKVVRLMPGTLKPLGRNITALIETGDYGVISNIIDTETGEVQYTKREQDADVLPFFIMFYVPHDRTSAIMISQRFKQFGATSIVVDTIRKRFRSVYRSLYLEVSALRSSALSDKFISAGSLKRITFKYFDSGLLGNVMNIAGLNPNEYKLEFSIVARRDKSIPGNVLNIFRNNNCHSKEIGKFIKIPYDNYSDVAFEIDFNDHRRTLRSADIESLGSFFDITNDIVKGRDGLPTYESIKKAALSILEDIKAL